MNSGGKILILKIFERFLELYEFPINSDYSRFLAFLSLRVCNLIVAFSYKSQKKNH